VVGVDLGVNTLVAATDGTKAVLISGREAKATVQWRNKRLASAVGKQAALVKGSRRWRRVQRRKARMLAKARRRMNDLIHKATHRVMTEFPCVSRDERIYPVRGEFDDELTRDEHGEDLAIHLQRR